MSAAFESLLRDAEGLWERVTTLAEEKWSPDQVNAVVAVVQRAQEALVAVNDCLDELPEKNKKAAAVRHGKQADKSSGQKTGRAKEKALTEKEKSKKVAEMESVGDDDDDDDQDETGKGKEEEEVEVDKEPVLRTKRRGVNLKAVMKAKKSVTPLKLRDGVVGKVSVAGAESLVYFSLGNEKDKVLFECPFPGALDCRGAGRARRRRRRCGGVDGKTAGEAIGH
jgi:hypothetical protein